MATNEAEPSKSTPIDKEFFSRFEQSVNCARIESSPMPAKVIGFGEISAVLVFDDVRELKNLVFKRLPIFYTFEEAAAYETLCADYVRIIREDVGIDIRPTTFFSVEARPGLVVFYAAQDKLPGDFIGHRILHWATEDENILFLELILKKLETMWEFNKQNEGSLEVTLDLQLSNWALLPDGSENQRVTPESELTYIDITTPLFRIKEKEQLDPSKTLRGCPPGLRYLVERFMADDVIGRYYEPRTICVDLLANCIKEQKEDRLPAMLDTVNRFFARKPAGQSIEPIAMKDIYSYYREDALIWMLYLGLKRLHRFIRTGMLRRPYDFILPGKIERNFPLRNSPKGVAAS